MLELTDTQRLRPETAREEIRRARRIKDSLTDFADGQALQRYIEELEAFLVSKGL
jgi:hypothetical protein